MRRYQIGLLLLSALVATGCASQRQLSAKQCANTDWQAVGYQDGANGLDATAITRHQQACAASGVLPNVAAWQQGQQAGHKQYCTPLRAYQLGREGIAYRNICPPEQTLDLLKAHDAGYLNYQREQLLEQLWYDNDPFWEDWGWGRLGGFGHVGRRYLPPRIRQTPPPVDGLSTSPKPQ